MVSKQIPGVVPRNILVKKIARASSLPGDTQAYVDGTTIYNVGSEPLSPKFNEQKYWHEVGHVVDHYLNDTQRIEIAQKVFGQQDWVPENFADAYSILMRFGNLKKSFYKNGMQTGNMANPDLYPVQQAVSRGQLHLMRQLLVNDLGTNSAMKLAKPWKQYK